MNIFGKRERKSVFLKPDINNKQIFRLIKKLKMNYKHDLIAILFIFNIFATKFFYFLLRNGIAFRNSGDTKSRATN